VTFLLFSGTKLKEQLNNIKDEQFGGLMIWDTGCDFQAGWSFSKNLGPIPSNDY